MKNSDTDTPKRKLRNPELTRESIARAALRIIDNEGSDALTFRRLSDDLGVALMTLYNRTSSREILLGDVVALLLSEIDTSPVEGESWADTVRRVARSHRAMALRHPRAYTLVVNTPFDEYPMLDHSISVLKLHDTQGIADEERYRFLSLVSSFVQGFMAMETQAVLRHEKSDQDGSPFTRQRNPVAEGISQIVRGDAFEHDIDVIVEGFRRVDVDSLES